MSKKRILIHGEASYASSGFGKMTKNFAQRLYNSGKYVVATLENFGHHSQVNRQEIPWRVYSVLPDPDEVQEYESMWENKFGAWRLNEVLLDFKPDYCFGFLDWWMSTALFNSPLRRFYKLGHIACLDSQPLKQDWLSMLEEADDIFAYTDWALDVIKSQSTSPNIRTTAAPGADFNIFKPHPNRKELREAAGLESDLLIMGMIARNQKRKLFPDLFASFRMFLDKYGKTHKELTDKCRLFLHSSYPDLGHDIPYLIKEFGLSNRVLASYLCRNCKKVTISYFRDARATCPHCRQGACVMPRVDNGVTESALSDIINLLDVYVQVCTNEGAGLPQIEAAACSTYIMATDYSGTHDIVTKTDGTPLRVSQLFKEVETQAYKAVPDNEYAADKFFEFFSLSEKERKDRGFNARMGAIKNYSYDKTTKILMEHIDKVDLDPNRWNEPPRLFQSNLQVPQFGSVYDFVEWAIRDVLGRPELINSPFHKRASRELTTGFRYSGSGTNIHMPDNSMVSGLHVPHEINPQQFLNELAEMRKEINHWELCRVGQIPVPKRNYILQAGGSLE